MLKVTLLNNTILLLFLFSCNQSPINKKTNNSKNKLVVENIDRQNKKISPKDQILKKDTIFSIFTSDMKDDDFQIIMDKLIHENKNFVSERRLFKEFANNSFDTNPKHSYNQNCYEMIINGKSYLFDIQEDFNPGFSNDDERSALSEKIDFILLHNQFKEKSAFCDIINLYTKKYGQFNKTEEIKKEYSFFFKIKPDSKTPVNIQKSEIYTWGSRPNLKMIFYSNHHLLDFFTGEKLDRFTYEIYIFYYSKVFFERLLNIKNIHTNKKINDSNKRELLLHKDI